MEYDEKRLIELVAIDYDPDADLYSGHIAGRSVDPPIPLSDIFRPRVVRGYSIISVDHVRSILDGKMTSQIENIIERYDPDCYMPGYYSVVVDPIFPIGYVGTASYDALFALLRRND